MINKIIKNIMQINCIVVVAVLMIILSACTVEQNYREVPSSHWQELTGEQKQLVVDQAYEQEFGSIVDSKKTKRVKL